jgi:multidrug efflux pump subunit AcrA (membrane-fusion protein)
MTLRYIALLALAACGGTPAASPAASISTNAPASPSAKPTPVKLSAAQLAAKKAAQAKAAAARKAAATRAAAAAKAAAAKAAAAAAAKTAAENTPISATRWGDVIRNPSAYVGDIYTISGTVAEYNISSNTFATVENAALVADDANGNDFVLECAASKLGNVQPGQTFTAKVTVVGVAQTQNTVSGGTGEVPDFDASTFTVTG